MKIYHISHTDLDGYACQFVANSFIKIDGFLNSNYGKEIDDKFRLALDKIGSEEGLILITDLNLTFLQAEKFEELAAKQGVKLLLLDHHKTGKDSEAKFPWYYLDEERCATKITYDFFAKIYGENEQLACFVEVVNAVDIWLSDDPNFELGKVCMGLISLSKEVNKILFEQEHTDYIFYLLEKMSEFVGEEEAHIKLDNASHAIKKEFFKAQKDDTLANLISAFLVKLLTAQKERLSVEYNGYKGLLTHNIGNISVVGNEFLLENEDFDFFMDVTSKKTISFRSNDKVDVSQMAGVLLGGGGHANAAGGFFSGFKECYDYESVKRQIVGLIESKKSYF